MRPPFPDPANEVNRQLAGARAAAVVIAAVAVLAAGNAQGQAPSSWESVPAEPVEHYNGTYLGLTAAGAFGVLDADGGQLGGGAEIGGRMGLVINVLDLALRYRFCHFGGEARFEDINRHSLALSGRLHPMFVRMTGQRFIDYVMSGFYVEFGLGLDSTSWQSGDRREDQLAGSVLLGAGMDIPMGLPDGPRSLWLELRYNRVFGLPPPGGSSGEPRFDEHVTTVGLSYRWHGLGFGRVSRPEELEFDE
jgi:hypothetical protein